MLPLVLQLALAMPCPPTSDWRGECQVLSDSVRMEVLATAQRFVRTDIPECREAFAKMQDFINGPAWRNTVWTFERNADDTPDSFVGAETIWQDVDRISLGISKRSFITKRVLAGVIIHEAGHMLRPEGGEAYAQRIERTCTLP